MGVELCPLGYWCIPETVHCLIGLMVLACMVLVAYNLDVTKDPPKDPPNWRDKAKNPKGK